ncbi:hypothetical protein D3880_22320 [Pseudomonas cavernae]|uniref:Uncharacterized protein n=1 Tax=Pseudomonas cavernae TaxID=2320867 RepID=A0A385Z9L7_9PSED|nr:hypothetical protein [Pseudomonas cavernae]AYC34937.1 hypothetical protein D3880_22320 [Pseudomonas cavernae]
MRRLSIFIVTLISLMLMGAATAFAAAPSAQNDRPDWQPFEGIGSNFCNGEDIAVTGKFLSEFNVMQDASGGVHVVVQQSTRGTGVGLTSGAKYVLGDSASGASTETTAGVVTGTQPILVRLIALDPDVPDLFIRALFHFTINANGEETSVVDTFEVLCDRQPV